MKITVKTDNNRGESLAKRLAKIRLIASDIDGVLTDGRITLDEEGREIRNFNAQDGMGLRLAKDFGVDLVFISGRPSGAAIKRLKDLGIVQVFQKIDDKGPVLEKILTRQGLKQDEVCAVGDDLADLPMFARSGVSVAVGNAVADVKEKAQWTTQRSGGEGALREVVEEILKAKGLWPRVLQRFSR